MALELLNRVDSDRSYLNLLLPKMQQRLPEKDRGFLQELTYGAIRWRLQYDLLIDNLVSQRILEPQIRNVLRLGAHQVFRMRVEAHAAVNETVELAKRAQPKATGLVNAVMRKFLGLDLQAEVFRLTASMRPIDRLSFEHSVPAWIVNQFAATLKVGLQSDELKRELDSLNRTPTVSLSAASKETIAQLVKNGAQPGRHSPTAVTVSGELSMFLGIPGVRVQDEGSQLIAQLVVKLAEQGNSNGSIVDLCAGPGGKAGLIADLLPKRDLICIEPIAARADLVKRSLGDRLAEVVVADGTQFQPEVPISIVLVDAPCSGLGSLRRKPESRWLKSETEIPQLHKLQMALLANAAEMLEVGGYLVYSTCSPVVNETTAVVAEFLEKHSNFELVDATKELREIAPSLNLPENRKTVQLWTGLHETDDMFMSIMRRHDRD